MNTFYLTTPLYYPNARPHVGSAYTTIVCDVLARYKRMCGYDVAFLTGTDEHGEKLQRAAEAAGVSPSEFVAEKRQLFVDLWKKLGIQYDYFVYTDQPDHATSVQRMLIRARENGYIEKKRYEGRYCVSDERYVSDSTDPVNCDICGRPAELISEENYFFKLSAFGGENGPLMRLYGEHPEFVQPDFRRNEVTSFVKGGLRDISVSRKRIKWGIPWPDDPEQVFYVWYDALIGYMTGLGYADTDEGSATFKKYWRNIRGSGVGGQGSGTGGNGFASSGEIVHMVGKDILRFHAIYWPAFIMAAYPDQPERLPTTVFAHGWIYYEQDKMSKSKGNVVYPEPIVEALDSLGAPGNDALRYYLLREAPFGQDTSFSYERLLQRYNSDLANDLGNLAKRTIDMLLRYYDGVLPDPAALAPSGPEDQLQNYFLELLRTGPGTLKATLEGVSGYVYALDRYALSYALINLWFFFVRGANIYLSTQEPWSEKGTIRRDRILYTAADVLRSIAILVYPVMPASAARIWKQLGCEGRIEDQRFSDLKWGGLKPGTKVGKPEPIFPRLDKAKALAKLEKFADADRERNQPKGAIVSVPEQVPSAKADSSSPAAPQNDKAGGGQSAIDNPQSSIPSSEARTPNPEPRTPASPQPTNSELRTSNSEPSKITIDDFAKVDLRVGTVLSAEAIPGAKKLLKLQVDIGTETRQVCAGIAEFYRPEELVGMKIVLVANLEPRKLRGIESNGMVVAASIGPEGKPVLATFKEDVPNGARLK